MMSLTERVATAALALLIAMPPAAAATQRAPVAAPRVQAIPIDVQCPPSPVPGTGQSFNGQSLLNRSFAYQDLRNADFSGATLDGVVFIGANLTGANFSGASFVNAHVPALPVDFMRADLTSACFIGAMFQATSPPTYFTRAILTGADFSSTDLTNAVFGPLPLIFNSAIARPVFRLTTMSCEFVAAWTTLDLSGATGIKACLLAKSKGFDFSHAMLANVDLSGLDLSGTTWTGADMRGMNFQGATLVSTKDVPITGMGGTNQVTLLAGALFNKATISGVDFSNAQLNGANFTQAKIENSSFAGAFLAGNQDPGSTQPASFFGARLKNVNMSNADVSGVNFGFASLFGSNTGEAPAPSGCNTDTSSCTASATGFTCSCATLKGAKMVRTNFSNAFLYGVDFSGVATQALGTNFSSAVLVAANFTSTRISPSTDDGGTVPNFTGALLQGAKFTGSSLASANLTNAFFDFGAPTNTKTNSVWLKLSVDYTKFAGWSGQTTPCVYVQYSSFGDVPGNVASMTCPDGTVRANGCGPTPSFSSRNPSAVWKSPLTLFGGGLVSGKYRNDSTYEPVYSGPDTSCKSVDDVDFKW